MAVEEASKTVKRSSSVRVSPIKKTIPSPTNDETNAKIKRIRSFRSNLVSRKGDGKSSSLPLAGTSKFIKRIRQNSVKSDSDIKDTKVGDEVCFLHQGEELPGIIRFLGEVNFSAGTWCGIELFEARGSNNGTLKGRNYFTCEDNYGIFIPLPKVSLLNSKKASERKRKKDKDDMKITVKSTKAVAKGNTSTSIIRHSTPVNVSEPSSKGPRSDVKEKARLFSSSNNNYYNNNDHYNNFTNKRNSLRRGGSISTPSPGKNIVVSAFITPAPRKPVLSSKENSVEEIKIEKDYKAGFIENNAEVLKDNLDAGSVDIPHSASFDKDAFEKLIDRKFGFSATERHNSFSDVDSTVSHENDIGDEITSKIPRRISSSSLKKVEEDQNKNETVFLEEDKTDEKTSTSSIPRLKFAYSSFKRDSSPKTSNNDISSSKRNSKSSSLPQHVSSKINKVALTKNDRRIDEKLNGTIPKETHESSTIESTSIPDTSKPNGLVNNTHNTHVIEETTSHKNKSRKISFPSSSSKQHLKQIEDLENQLKERNERIQQLEIELKNSNNEYIEEKNAKNSLVNDLIEKSNIQINLETQVASAQKYIDSSNKKLEAFIIILQQYLSQIDTQAQRITSQNLQTKETQQHVKHLESTIDEITKLKESAHSRSEILQDELKNLSRQHEEEIKKLIDENEKKIQGITLKANHERSELVQKHNEELEKLHKDKEQAIQQVKRKFEDLLAKTTETNDKKEDDIKRNYENKLEEIESNYKLDIQKLNEDREEKEMKLKEIEDVKQQLEKNLKAKEENYTEEIERLKRNHEERCKSLQLNLEELSNASKSNPNSPVPTTSPTSSIEAELKSLQVVVEMKSEEVKTLRIQKMELERKMDDYYELQTKFDNVSQRNQSLEAALKKKTLVERRLSAERDTYIERFEKETRKVSRLSMEKEELMWRASNPDISSSTPNVFFEEEEYDTSKGGSPPARKSSLSNTINHRKLKRRTMNFPLTKSDLNLMELGKSNIE